MSTRAAASANSSLPPALSAASSAGLYHKTNALASVQDAYWSDDEAEDNECPLCLEEMDLSDMNFKPCPCGYQICRFCWHHIKTNLNGKCPACRRDYTEEAVEFKPVGKEDQKRLAQKKRQKEKERRDLDALGRRHLTNVRIVQRNMIYVTGIGQRFAKEELLPTLRSSEYFGQYGKITKILLVKRTPPSNSPSRDPVVGLYINYYRREDAARAIGAVDGAPSPSGGGEVMRASYGTTKYCANFLRGVPCTNQGCLDLHDWGDERDCFTKEDLSTLKHTIKDGEHRSRQSLAASGPARKSEEAERKAAPMVPNLPASYGRAVEAPALPKTASWARPGPPVRPASPSVPPPPGLQSSRPVASRTTTRPREAPIPSRPVITTAPLLRPVAAAVAEKKIPIGTIRPATEAAQSSAAAVLETPPIPKPSAPAPPPNLPAPPLGIPASASSSKSILSQPSRPTAIPSPAVVASPSRPPGIEASTSVGIVASTSTYRMTNQGKALLDDVLNLRETAPAEPPSPFPEFDRTLLNLQKGGGFSFSLDLNSSATARMADSRSASDWSAPTSPALSKLGVTPISIPLGSGELERMASPVYSGSFNPFDPPKDERSGSQGPSVPSSRAQSPAEGEEVRRSSRFGFARRPGGGFGTPGSSYRPIPSLTSSPTKFSETLGTTSPGLSSSILSPLHQLSQPQNSAPNWSYGDYTTAAQPSEWSFTNNDTMQALSPQAEARAFKSFDLDSDAYGRQEHVRDNAMLHKVLNIGGSAPLTHASQPDNSARPYDPRTFQDPAIMSVHPNAPFHSNRPSVSPLTAGPPPGLAGPATTFQNDQTTPYASSPRGGRIPAGSSGSSRMGAGSPSFNSAISLSNAEDLEGASVSGEGNAPDVESNIESQSVSAVVSTPSSPMLPRQSLEITAAQLAALANAEVPPAAEAEVPPLSEADFPALPTSQPAATSSKREMKRPTVNSRPTETKATVPLRKVTAGKKAVGSTSSQKQSEQVVESPISQDSPLVPPSAKPSTAMKKELKEVKAVVTLPPAISPPVKKASQPVRPAPQVVRPTSPEPAAIAPFLSRKIRKVKAVPAVKPTKKASKETAAMVDEEGDTPETEDTGDAADNAFGVPLTGDVTPVDPTLPPFAQDAIRVPASLSKMLNEIGRYLDVEALTLFDTGAINTKGQSNIRYAPLVHALSTLSSGTSFTSNMPNSSIDSAVSSFQQLLETLTQTISDILHLLPRNTWDDSSSFDGVLREMLRAEDLLDEVNENGEIRDDEVASLTMALEKRARWMEHQLTKLEDLHRDINSTAVRAVLSINDRGWDPTGFLPRQGDSLPRFDALGQEQIDEMTVFMGVEELEESLADAKAKEAAAEGELKYIMHRNCSQLWLA